MHASPMVQRLLIVGMAEEPRARDRRVAVMRSMLCVRCGRPIDWKVACIEVNAVARTECYRRKRMENEKHCVDVRKRPLYLDSTVSKAAMTTSH